jgi:hypothetical protein
MSRRVGWSLAINGNTLLSAVRQPSVKGY